MPAHLAGLPRSVSFAFIVIAVTRGFTDATATRASFTLATLRDLILPGMAASFSFQVRSSEVVWISMISLRGLHLFVLPARCHVHMQGSPEQRRRRLLMRLCRWRRRGLLRRRRRRLRRRLLRGG